MDEPRWSTLLVLSFLAGLALAGAPHWEAAAAERWPAFAAALRDAAGAPPPPWAPGVDWLFALALATAWHCRAPGMFGAMGWCGLMRDLFLGGRLGANALLFMAAGWLLDGWRRGGAHARRHAVRWLAGGALALGVGLLRPLLESPGFWVAYSPAVVRGAALTALWTMFLSPLVEGLLWATKCPTWRPAARLR